MDFVIDVIKVELDGVIGTGQFMLSGLFLLAVLMHYLGAMHQQVSWSGLIIRLVIGFVLLQNYVWLMDTTKEIVVGLDQRINPDQSAINQYASMVDNLRQEYEENVQRSITSKILNFGKDTMHNLIVNLSFIFYAIVSRVMEAIRFSLAGILYKLGPILIPLVLFNSTKRVLSGWYTSYVSVLAWPILWHITLSIAVAISQRIGLTGEGIEYFVALNFAVGFVLIFSPVIVTSLAAGIGTGATAALAGIFATRAASNTVRQGTRLGVAGAAGAVTGGAQAAQSVAEASIKPVTLGQRIGNVMSNIGTVSKGSIYGGIKSMADKMGIRASYSEQKSLSAIRKSMKGQKDE